MYKTFTAALLAAVIETPQRAAALTNAVHEPIYNKQPDGARFVTYNETNFTLIVRYSPPARAWVFSWTWTDTATK